MDDLIATAVQWLDQGRKVALATVISTWGSSPRPVGSQLVVDEKGAFQGSVSGGCIESTVITEAQHTLGGGQPQLLSVGIDADEAWDSGLACGGTIEIYIEDLCQHRPLLDRLLELTASDRRACLVTDLQSGQKTLVAAPAGRADLSPGLQAAADRVMRSGRSQCRVEGNKRFFLQAFAPAPQLVIIGAVHIAQALIRLARLTGYKPFVVDPRMAFATRERFPDAELVTSWPDKAFERIRLHAGTAVVALSHAPRLDDPALARALRSEAFYIGALGSRNTHADRLARLQRQGFDPSELQRIHGPIGILIGSVTPEEIALSIMAEITRARRMTEAAGPPESKTKRKAAR